jgi:ABC-2 type transport system ATP-binding protein
MIATRDLTKSYGGVLALDRLTLEIPGGAVFGLLGPNGSGKSTLVRLIMGFILPDVGRVDRGGLAAWQIGYLPERPYFPPWSPARECLETLGSLGGLRGRSLRRVVDGTLERMGLTEAAGWRIGAFSKGMLQRLSLAAAFLSDPPLIILDEPMEGLDPSWQKALRETIRSLHVEGKTILFSTHRLGDVAALCTHVGILSRGRLVRCGGLEEVAPLRSEVRIDVAGLLPETAAALAALDPAVDISSGGIVLSGDAVELKRRVLGMLVDAGADIVGISQPRASLEEVYLEAMSQ